MKHRYFNTFESLANRVFRNRRVEMLSYGSARLTTSQSERLYSILTCIAPVDERLTYYSDEEPVAVSTSATPEQASVNGFNWTFDGEDGAWELDIVFHFDGHTIEYHFYNNEKKFGITAFVFDFFETGYEGHQLPGGVIDDITHEEILTILNDRSRK